MFKGTIRELESGDAEAVEGIFDLYWSGDFRENLSKRLRDYIARTSESLEQGFKYFVAEENGEVVGVAALRKVPEHMKQFATTENAAEFYVLAVKRKGEGAGEALRLKRIEEAKSLGYTEIVLYGGETHKESWGFHDRLGFERVGPAVAPNGEAGYIWRKILP